MAETAKIPTPDQLERRPTPPTSLGPSRPSQVMKKAAAPPDDLKAISPQEHMAALYEATARFSSPSDIAKEVGMTFGDFLQLRENPVYQRIVKSMVEELARVAVENARNPIELFNSQIMPSVRALMVVRDDPFAKDGDRVKAAKEILDKAPDAPRAKKEGDGGTTVVVQVPVSHMKAIRAAFVEDGDGDALDLLEGRDFDSAAEEGASGEEVKEIEFSVPVVDMGD
jgi:hypothetical protein